MIETTVFGSGSSGNGYMVDDGETQILIEAGISYKKVAQKLGYDFGRVKALVISHEHGDHAKYIKQYLEETSIDIYMSAGTARALGIKESYRVHFIGMPDKKHVVGWTIQGFDVEHDAEEPLGFVMSTQAGDRLLYVTDTYYVKYRFTGITHMMVEMNYAEEVGLENVDNGQLNGGLLRRINQSHFEMADALNFIRENYSSSLREIMLIHVSGLNSDPGEFVEKVQKLTGVPVTIAGVA